MDNNLLFTSNEKPLDNILSGGGLTAILRKICVVGDSLSSGEFESRDENGNPGYHDMYEYSWGQYIARMCGSEVYNFSRGGMTAKVYLDTFADSMGLWDTRKAPQAYIIALGVNDMAHLDDLYGGEIGTADDICLDDYTKNKKSFAGCYGAIVQRYKNIQPNAKFFFITVPKSYDETESTACKYDKHRELLESLAKKFSNSYVIDLRKYEHIHDEEYKKNFYLYNHLNPAGYYMSAKTISSYIDYIIRHDLNEFKEIGFVSHY